MVKEIFQAKGKEENWNCKYVGQLKITYVFWEVIKYTHKIDDNSIKDSGGGR